MSFRRRLLALITVVGLPLVACLDDSITGSRAISITLEVEPATTPVDESVTFTFVATGTDIAAVLVDFGDGTADTLTYPNPVEVADERSHTYTAPGSYTAVGTVVTPSGRGTDEVVVTVN